MMATCHNVPLVLDKVFNFRKDFHENLQQTLVLIRWMWKVIMSPFSYTSDVDETDDLLVSTTIDWNILPNNGLNCLSWRSGLLILLIPRLFPLVPPSDGLPWNIVQILFPCSFTVKPKRHTVKNNVIALVDCYEMCRACTCCKVDKLFWFLWSSGISSRDIHRKTVYF